MPWISWYGTSGGVSSWAKETGAATESTNDANAIRRMILLVAFTSFRVDFLVSKLDV
jgi:hypothetical protein